MILQQQQGVIVHTAEVKIEVPNVAWLYLGLFSTCEKERVSYPFCKNVEEEVAQWSASERQPKHCCQLAIACEAFFNHGIKSFSLIFKG